MEARIGSNKSEELSRLWRSLRAIAQNFAPLQGTDFAELEKRAQDQFEQVETLRLEMAREAFRA